MEKIQKFKDAISGRSFDENTARSLCALSAIPSFSHLLPTLSAASSDVLQAVLDGSEPHKHIPTEWVSTDKHPCDPERACLLKIMLIKALRPEYTVHALEEYVTTVFSHSFDWRDYYRPDLKNIVDTDTTATHPVMLCSELGQDASGKVDALAATVNKTLLQVAMGSAEGFVEADRNIAQALKTGVWVLLRNVHLCIDWLNLLEKRISAFTPHPEFRLFLTCEIHPNIPTALLRMSDVIVYEASTGIKANILRFYNSIPTARIDRAPAERCRLYSLLCWLNAVVQERRRYCPLGWTKRYEFSEADAMCAIDVIDEWLDGVSGSGAGEGRFRPHVDPAKIPWAALRTLLCQSLYGGRVDVPFDQVQE
jgi:dynein heavy chain 1